MKAITYSKNIIFCIKTSYVDPKLIGILILLIFVLIFQVVQNFFWGVQHLQLEIYKCIGTEKATDLQTGSLIIH